MSTSTSQTEFLDIETEDMRKDEHNDDVVWLEKLDPSISRKKRKFMDYKKPTVKKTSRNSYKRLIRPNEPKQYLRYRNRSSPRKYWRLICGFFFFKKKFY